MYSVIRGENARFWKGYCDRRSLISGECFAGEEARWRGLQRTWCTEEPVHSQSYCPTQDASR